MTSTRKKQPKEKPNAKEESLKTTASSETLPVQTFDEYQCSGNVEIDFPALCDLLDLKDIPSVIIKEPVLSISDGANPEVNQSKKKKARSWSKPYVEVELCDEDFVKGLKISGWKVSEQIFRVLEKLIPSVSQLLSLQFWQAGLTDPMVISLMNTISLCSSLRTVRLEGNILPEQSYHLLLSEDSLLTDLSLRNNQIGDEGARLIGSALSTTRSANRNLSSLNLAFNSIGDAGASYIAQGLRLNRALRFLSLCNNQIGDSGAAFLAAILGELALTHEEVVERRKLLLEKAQSSKDSDQSPVDQLLSGSSSTSLGKLSSKKKLQESSKKDDKHAASKESQKSNKKSQVVKTPRSKGDKHGAEDKQQSALEVEAVEMVSPLLDKSVYRRDGQLFLPGNTTLTSLNLAGNRITGKSLPLFLALLETNGEGRTLSRLCLQRNRFLPDCECYMKINEMMAFKDQKNTPETTDEEEQGPSP